MVALDVIIRGGIQVIADRFAKMRFPVGSLAIR
jgi:hypothetical protein